MKGVAALCCVLTMVCQMSLGAALADSAADCMTLVDNSIELITEKGLAYAIKTINCKGPFTRGEVYVFAVSMDNVVLAHPYQKDLIGKTVNDLRDPKGNLFFAEFKKVATNGGSGWIDYWWSKSGEKGEFPKKAFIKKVPGEDLYVGAGFYVK